MSHRGNIRETLGKRVFRILGLEVGKGRNPMNSQSVENVLNSTPTPLIRARGIAQQMAGYSSAIAFQNILSQKTNHTDFISETSAIHTLPVSY